MAERQEKVLACPSRRCYHLKFFYILFRRIIYGLGQYQRKSSIYKGCNLETCPTVISLICISFLCFQSPALVFYWHNAASEEVHSEQIPRNGSLLQPKRWTTGSSGDTCPVNSSMLLHRKSPDDARVTDLASGV